MSRVPQFVIVSENKIPTLDGDNFSDCKERILLTLGWMDLDLALRVDEPGALTDTNTQAEKLYFEQWERSNRHSLNLIQSHMRKNIRGSIPKCDKVKDYLKAIEERFVSSEKALGSTLMNKMSSMKYYGDKGVREHIMEMRDSSTQLKTLEMEISETFLVHFIFNSLPTEYGPFKISYNTTKDKWSINELLTMCVQEEGRLKQEKLESAHLVSQGNVQGKKPQFSCNKGKNKMLAVKKFGNKDSKPCFFCNKKGHIKKECEKYKAWLVKKSNLLSLVCYESNMVNVQNNTWWIDSGLQSILPILRRDF